MMIDLTGQQFGNYRLVKRLGYGGFASVYLGQHLRIASLQAAIKVLHLTQVDTQKFEQEAETIASLRHPHIVRLLDFHIQQGTPFLVMDHAPNGSLHKRHSSGEQLPLAVVVLYVKQIADALQYAHDKNIIHRDIKPDNVLIGPHGELLLGDFGIAVISKTGLATLQPSYGTAGTPYYMAPEMFRAKPEKASDQYALGVMVYQWLSGTRPFTGDNVFQLGHQHIHEPVPPLRDNAPFISAAVETVVMRAMAKQPQDRFPSVRAFAEALETVSKKPPIGTRLLAYRGHNDAPGYTCAWSPDSRRLATGGNNGLVKIWNAVTGEHILTCQDCSVAPINAVAWSPDGSRLASASSDKTVQVWDARSGSLFHSYTGHSDSVCAVAWSPDGSRLASASIDRTVQVWDARSGSLLHSYTGHTNGVYAVAWSPDGSRLTSASWDHTVQIWDARSGSLLHSYTGHSDSVCAVAWSPDGTCIASGADNGVVIVWQAV